MKQQQSITTLPLSPSEERHRRMVRYGITMGIRFICFFLIFVVQGWWLLVVVVAAVILPYIAVVVANVSVNQRQGSVLRPGTVASTQRSLDS